MTSTLSGPLAPARRGRTAPHPRRNGRRGWGDLLLLVPAVTLVGLLIAVPTGFVIVQSFYDWRPGIDSPFVGIDNYVELLTSRDFQQILINQLVLLMGLPLYTIVPLILALLLYERVRGSAIFRTIFFFPSVLAPPIVAIMMRAVLADDGAVNSFLRSVGLDGLAQPWLTSEDLVKPTLIVILTWANLGTGVVIFSAALSALPPEQLEAALIDGANWWQRLRSIVIPEIRPTIELWIAVQTIAIFAFSFAWIFVLTNGGPNSKSATLDFDIYQNAMQFGFFGLAAAESVFLLLIVATLGLVQARLRRRARRAEEESELVREGGNR